MAGSNRAQRLSGINPLAYMGVEPITPPLLIINNTAPTVNDANGFFLGSVWVVNVIPYQIWVLVSLVRGIATWVQIYPASGSSGAVTKFTAQTGTNPIVPDGTGNVNITGVSTIPGLLTSSGSLNTIDLVVGNAVAASFTGDTGTATPIANTLAINGNTFGVIRTTATGGVIEMGFSTATDLQVVGGVTAGVPTWQTLTSTGASVAITKSGNTINFEATGTDVGAVTFATDSGNATVSGTTITIAGGDNISTSGATSIVTVNVAKTTNHAVQVGKTGTGLTQVGPGTAGQVLLSGGGAADPSYVTPLATAGGGGLTLVTDATHLNYGITAPVSIANGGTNATSMATTDGTVYYDGTRLVTTATGTIGQVLTSNGAGVAPSYQAAGGGGGVAGTQAFFYYQATTNTVTPPNPTSLDYNMGALQPFTPLFDNGGNVFPGNGTGTGLFFTAPDAGIYQFTWQLCMIRNNAGVGSTLTLLTPVLQMVSSLRTFTYGFDAQGTHLNSTGGGLVQNVQWTWTVMVQLPLGGTMEFVVSDPGSSSQTYIFEGSDNTGGIASFVQGYRIA